jgi:hypothetical protein
VTVKEFGRPEEVVGYAVLLFTVWKEKREAFFKMDNN